MPLPSEVARPRTNRRAALILRFGLVLLGITGSCLSSVWAETPASLNDPEPIHPVEPSEMRTVPMTWGQAFDKHAPLAFFSVGSLAVGGILVGIRSENAAELNTHSRSPDRDLIVAVSLAGIGSLVSAGAFWYYSRHEMQGEQGDAEVTGREFSLAPILQKGGGLAARLRIPFTVLGG